MSPSLKWSPGCGCCQSCDPIPLPLTDAGATRLHESWLCDDTDNVTVVSLNRVTIDGDTLRPAQSAAAGDTVSGAHTISDTTITTVGSATYEGNRTIKFSDHATEYTVVKHVGTTLTISPGLTQAVADAVTISDQTPLVSLGTHEAYYLHTSFRTTTGVVKINQGSGPDNELEVDIDNQTIDFNAQAQQDLPFPKPSVDHQIQFYICPTHSMGEASIQFAPGEVGVPAQYASHNAQDYGCSVVDSASQTADNDFELEITGSVTLAGITYYPAEVEMDAYDTAIVDCGRRDLFPCPWMFWKQFDFTLAGATNINMAVTGWDEYLEFSVWDGSDYLVTKWGDRLVWNPISRPAGQATHASYAKMTTCEMTAYRQQDLYDPAGSVLWYGNNVTTAHGMTYRASVAYTRADPTTAEPYPEPGAEASLEYEDEATGQAVNCVKLVETTTTLASAAAVKDGFTVAAVLLATNCGTNNGNQARPRDGTSTLTWTHP